MLQNPFEPLAVQPVDIRGEAHNQRQQIARAASQPPALLLYRHIGQPNIMQLFAYENKLLVEQASLRPEHIMPAFMQCIRNAQNQPVILLHCQRLLLQTVQQHLRARQRKAKRYFPI
ncbi:hypothetical protein D3C78_838560 [compost metagenome]